MSKFFFFVIFLLYLFPLGKTWGQSTDIDSLKSVASIVGKDAVNLSYEGLDYQALEKFQEYLDLRKKIYSDDGYYWGSGYSNIGVMHKNLGQLDLALENFQLAEKSYLLRDNPYLGRFGDLYVNIGNVYRAKLDYTNAMNYFEKALNVFLNQDEIDPINISNVYYSIAEVNYLRKNYNEAIQILTQNIGSSDIENKIYYNELLALNYQETDLEGEAWNHYEKAVALAKEVYENTGVDLVNIYMNYATFLWNMKEYDLGIANLNSAHDILIEVQPVRGELISRYYELMGSFYGSKTIETQQINRFKNQKKQNLNTAIDWYMKSLNALSSSPKEIDISTIKIEDFSSFLDGLAILQQIGEAFYDMALTEKEEKTELYTSSLIQALNYYGAASRLTQQARLEISNDESKIQLAGLEYSTFAKTIEAAYLAYDVTADNAYLELAFHNSEQLKSSAVFDKLSNDLAQENSLIPDSLIQKEKKLNSIISLYNQKKFEENSRELPDSVLIEEYTTKILEERNNKPDTLLVAEYNHKILIEKKKQRPDSTLIDLYSNKIFEENRRSPDSLLMAEYFNKILEEKQKGPDSTLIDEYDQIIFAANKEREELNHMLEEEYADYYNLKYSKNMLSAEEIQQQMDDDEAIFEYVIVDPDKESGKETDADTTSQLYTFLITKEKLIFQRKSIEENTQESIENVFSFMSSSAYLFTKNSDSKAFCTASNKLYNLLVAPYEKELLNKNLVFIPDGQLNYISFDGLLMSLPDTSKTINFSKLDYLIKDYNINYANSANILFQNRGLRKKLSNKTLAFAPEYDSRKFEMSNDTFILAPLPGVQKEVSSIASTVKTKIFRGKDATEQNFRANSKHYDILHLAMHAYINDSQPAFSRLAFSPSLPGEEKDINEDGWLNTSDIYTLELNARLAVLSACNTGVGKLRKGEGMMSLARGFLYAGCPSIIMSLWEVEDKSGTHIMSSFYKNLKKGKTKDQALRLAKLEYLNQSNSRLAHPHYWMSFKSIGDNSQIYTSYDIYFFAMLIVLMLAFTIDQTLRIRKVRKQKQDY